MIVVSPVSCGQGLNGTLVLLVIYTLLLYLIGYIKLWHILQGQGTLVVDYMLQCCNSCIKTPYLTLLQSTVWPGKSHLQIKVNIDLSRWPRIENRFDQYHQLYPVSHIPREVYLFKATVADQCDIPRFAVSDQTLHDFDPV